MGIWLRDPPFAPSIAFGRHDPQNYDFWPKSLPEKAASGTGKQHGLASSMTPFFDLRWSDLQCQTSRPEPIKKDDFLQLWGSICTSNWLRTTPLAPSVAFGRHDGQNHDFWPKSLPKKAASGTGKQHGLASSRTPFFDLCWGDLQCQTLRPEPIKNGDLASRSTVCTFNCVWASRPAKTRRLTKSLPKNAGFKTAKQHGLASSRTPFFDRRWRDLQCQTLRPEPLKREDLASRSTVRTFNCVWASWPAKPQLLTQKPSQKGWLRNRETAWPGELKDIVFRPALGWSSVSNVACLFDVGCFG